MLALALAGCDGTAVSSAQPNVLESDAEANVGVTASPTPTGHPKPQATAEPTPTPPPVPRKPTGVTFRFHNEVLQGGPGDTDGIGDYILKVTWERPRRKGTEIRVYGVTKCFDLGAGSADDSCLRKQTPLPAELRVLVARASASKGKVTFRLPLGGDGGFADEDGRPIYSFVIAAYNESGHSIFEIVDPGTYCGRIRECDTY